MREGPLYFGLGFTVGVFIGAAIIGASWWSFGRPMPGRLSINGSVYVSTDGRSYREVCPLDEEAIIIEAGK